MSSRSDKEWMRVGRKEPFFGDWINDRFLTSSHDEQAEEQILLSGEQPMQSESHFVLAHLQGLAPGGIGMLHQRGIF